jgi:hypothetical protein
MSNNCPIPPDCYDLEPVPICVRPVADPFACAQPAYLIGFCDAGTQKYRLEYPLGTALAGLYENWVQLPSTECKCQPKPPAPPVDAPATTCTTDTTVKAADLLSQAVHTAPGTALLVKLCPSDPKFDREFVMLCAPDGTKVITQNVTKDDAPLGTAPTIEAWTLAGVPYTGSIAALTDCGSEKVDLADSESYCAAGTNYSRIDVIDVTTKAIIGTLWLNDAGTVVAAPVGAVKGTCEQIASNTAIIAQLTAANVTLAALLAEQDKELSFTTPIQICAGGVGYLVRQRSVYDSEAATPVSLVAEYTTDGVAWSTTAPVGAITLGECPKCEVTKQFEFLNYHTPETTGLQPKVLGLHQGIDGVDFNQSAGGDFEFYLVVDGVPQIGNGAGAGYGAQYPLQFPTLQSIADWLNAHPANTAPKDTWAVAGLAGAQSLVIPATIGGVAPNHVWADMVLAHYVSAGSIDYNFFKTSPSSINVEMVLPATCRTIEVLKEIDCNRAVTLFGFEIDGTPIAGFDKANLKHGIASSKETTLCAVMTNSEVWTIKAIETTTACGDTTFKYVDPDVYPQVEIDKALVASIIREGDCKCCDKPTVTLPPMALRRSYTGGATGLSYATDKFTASTDLQWQIKVLKNGADIVNSAVSPALTTLAAAVAWVNSASQGYFTINATGVGNGRMMDYTAPDNSGTDEWLIIITETVTNYTGTVGTLVSPQNFSYTNRGTSFGSVNATGGTGSPDYADSIGTVMDWANRMNFGWYAN